MSKKYRVKTKAVFNGQPIGSTIELSEDLAKKYEALKYLEIISEVRPRAKKAAAPKKPAAKNTTTSKEK